MPAPIDLLLFEDGVNRATPVLIRIRDLATHLCGTETERVKFLDGMIARTIHIVRV